MREDYFLCFVKVLSSLGVFVEFFLHFCLMPAMHSDKMYYMLPSFLLCSILRFFRLRKQTTLYAGDDR